MSIKKVRKAIEIQGYIVVNAGGRAYKARRVDIVDGVWVTDVTTSDMMGYIRIKKTKRAVIAQAERIIEREEEIRARRESDRKASLDWAMRS